MPITARNLEQAENLYDRGLFLAAYRSIEGHGPLQRWQGTEPRLFAGRLAAHLGARRLGQAIHLRTWRADPRHPDARLYAAYAIGDRRGPWEAWRLSCEGLGAVADDPHRRARFLTLQAQTLAALRDFHAAEARLDEAEALAQDAVWTHLVRAFLLHQQDRYEESLTSARCAQALRPGSPQPVMAEAYALTSLGRDAEAIAALEHALRETESGQVALLLAAQRVAGGDARGALDALDRAVALSPLMERPLARNIAAQRSDAHYRCGDRGAAIRFAREADTPFHRETAERLERAHDGKRVALDVGFVKQHHKTCAPATLTAISRFWSREADHLGVAEEICYDGTSAHSERNWAAHHGWVVREFTVTWDGAVALLDRGAPFTLTTVGPTYGHLQAVIGYDTCRETFIVRDPSFRNEIEYAAQELLERARVTGPRGMVLVPQDRSELLERVALSDAEWWDRSHAVHDALEAHDRDAAYAIYRAMASEDPGHLLTQYTRRALAAYDADPIGMLAFADSMLQRFPGDPGLLMSKLGCYAQLGRDGQNVALLADVCRDRRCHPALLVAYAAELARDTRRHDEARRVLRRVHRIGYVDARCLMVLGDLEWGRQRFDNALELYRFGACLEELNESLAQAYFSAALVLNRAEEAEVFLERRAERHACRSPASLLTLCQACRQMGRSARVLELLDSAVERHPEDAKLMVAASRYYANLGWLDRAEEVLAPAETRGKRTDWLRASAELAARRGDLERSLGAWGEVLEVEPLALDANHEVAELLSSLQGQRAATRHLDDVCSRFPHNLSLQKLRAEWLLVCDRGAAEPALSAMIEASPVNTWARLQLALLLGEREAFQEAFAEAELTVLLDPNEASGHSVRGKLLALAGRRGEAAAALRLAIGLNVAFDGPVRELLALSSSDEERQEALADVRREILKQPSAGNAPTIYSGFARELLSAESLLESLEDMRQTRPDHRQCWSAAIRQLVSMGRMDEALRLSDRYAQRFPREPEAWLEAAHVRRSAKDLVGEEHALRNALRVAPDLGYAYRGLAENAVARHRPDESRRVLEEAVAAAPLDALNHGWLAECLWKAGEREAALPVVERALSLDADYAWAWQSLRSWSAELGQPERALAFGRQLARRRPGEVRAWLNVADLLAESGAHKEGEATLREALSIDPGSVDAHDRFVTLLAEVGRYDEAHEACRPEAWPNGLPLALQGRAAWVEAHRGNLGGAIERMRGILETSPTYWWGWTQLTDWHRRASDAAGYLDAATRLTQLASDEPVSLGHLGHAKLVNGDAAGAKAAFRTAFELAPGYAFAGEHLFELQLEAGELEAAGRTLEQLSAASGPESVLAMQVRLDGVAGDRDAALDGLRRLCLIEGVADQALHAAAAEAARHWTSEVARLLDEVVTNADAHPYVGELWVNTRPVGRLWEAGRERVDVMDPRLEIATRARRRLLERLAEESQAHAVQHYVERYGDVLRPNTVLWGTALYALATVGRWRFLLTWAGAWTERDGLEPWMLINLAVALRSLGKIEPAVQASLRAMMLAADNSTPQHAAWLAVEEALAGETAVAETWLAYVQSPEPSTWEMFLMTLARAVMAERFQHARELLAEARDGLPAYDKAPALHEIYRRSVRAIGRRRGGIRGALWRLGAR